MGESKSKTYTITDISKNCGVSVASISKYVKRNKLTPVETGENNAKLFSAKDYETIVKYYRSKRKDHTANHVQTTKDDVISKQSETIELLKKQLAEKDKQIQRQNDQIDHLTTAVGNIGDLTKQVAGLTSNAQQLQLAEKASQLKETSSAAHEVKTTQNDDTTPSEPSKNEHGPLYNFFHGIKNSDDRSHR